MSEDWIDGDGWTKSQLGEVQSRALILAEMALILARRDPRSGKIRARSDAGVTLMAVTCTHPKLRNLREHYFREKLVVRNGRFLGWQYRDRTRLHEFPPSAPNADARNYQWNCPRCPEHLCLTTKSLEKVIGAATTRAIEDAVAGVGVPGQRAKLDISEALLLLSISR